MKIGTAQILHEYKSEVEEEDEVLFLPHGADQRAFLCILKF